MKALARLPASQGIAAMQSINVTAVMPAFMSAFIGSAIACAALAVTSIFTWDEPYAVYLLIGSLCYLIGTFGLTIGYHVPRNDALADGRSERRRAPPSNGAATSRPGPRGTTCGSRRPSALPPCSPSRCGSPSAR